MKTPNSSRWSAALTLTAVVTLLALFTSRSAYGQANAFPPGKMTFQGFLTDAGNPPVPLGNSTPENKSVTFKIYKSATSAAVADVLWAEQQVVTVDKGHFSVLLGEGSALSGLPHATDLSGVFTGADASDRWIGITVDGSEITPRIQFFAAPYAQLARAANSLTSGAVFNGNAQIGSAASPGATLEFGAGKSGKEASAGKIGYETFTAGALDIVGAGAAGGSRTIKFWDNAIVSGSLGIGTSPGASLDVRGDAIFQRTGGTTLTVQTPASDARIYASGTSSTLLLNPGGGNVGIGTFTPGSALEINSTSLWRPLTVRGSGGTDVIVVGNSNGRAQIGAHNGALSAWANLTIASHGGNVGVGTGDTAPAAKLHLSGGGMRIDTQNVIEFGGGLAKEVNNGKIGYQTFSSGLDIVGAGADVGNRRVTIFAQGGTTFNGNIYANGWYGHGTTTPRCPMDLNGWGDTAIGPYAYLNGNANVGIFNANAAASYTILCRTRVAANEFNVYSDARTKEVVGLSNNQSDLETIQKLKVTDYRMVDKVTESGRKKGFIAQEVKAVIPDAVTLQTQFVPDIYSLPSAFEFDKDRHTLNVTVPKAHGLKKGDRVRMMTDQGVLELTVAAAPSPTQFVVDQVENKVEQIFVWGKEVADFHNLDYDRIFVTGIGAIQELARQVESLKKSETRIAELEAKTAKFSELEQKAVRVDSLEREVAELKKLVAGLAQGQIEQHSSARKVAAVQP